MCDSKLPGWGGEEKTGEVVENDIVKSRETMSMPVKNRQPVFIEVS